MLLKRLERVPYSITNLKVEVRASCMACLPDIAYHVAFADLCAAVGGYFRHVAVECLAAIPVRDNDVAAVAAVPASCQRDNYATIRRGIHRGTGRCCEIDGVEAVDALGFSVASNRGHIVADLRGGTASSDATRGLGGFAGRLCAR